MNRNTLFVLTIILASSNTLWAKDASPAPEHLSEKGQQLEVAYTAEMDKLRAEIQSAAFAIDEGKKKIYQQALDAESQARGKFNFP